LQVHCSSKLALVTLMIMLKYS